MVGKLCQSTIDHHSFGTSLTVTGAGGFGKTSLATDLCHHDKVKEQFRDGVVFIELGPQATDPSMKLKGLYNLLTDKQCDVNVVEQQIKQLTSFYCHNLLVIIDDVWHVEDAEPIVKAFSSCKIVLTTRMNDIEQYIPTKEVVCVGPMEQSEAISLLTSGVFDISQLSKEGVSLLNGLTQDVHLWPLLLSLIRGQLSHNLKYQKCYHEAIQFVQAKLYDKGLTAFDKNNIQRSRRFAVKSCIEVTLELLTKSLSDKLKSLILYNGIGTSLEKAVSHNLWNISEHEATETVDALWSYGLVKLTDITMPPQNNTLCCVEVHAVISQYIIESMDSFEVSALSAYCGLGTSDSVCQGSLKLFRTSYGISKVSSLYGRDYLIYKLNELECNLIPYFLKSISMGTIIDPHDTIVALKIMRDALMTSPRITLTFPLLNDEVESLISDCHKVLKVVHKLSRDLNQNVQRCLTQRDHPNLIQTIEKYNKEYPIARVAQQAVTMVKKTIPYCDGHLLTFIKEKFEYLQRKTTDYHTISLQVLPFLKLYTKYLHLIYASLQTGLPDIEIIQYYFKSGQHQEEEHLLDMQHYAKLQEVAPNIVRNKVTNIYNS